MRFPRNPKRQTVTSKTDDIVRHFQYGMTQHFTGAASELYTSYRLIAMGHQVFLPAFTQSKADLVVDIGGTLKRVQVKTGTKLKHCNSIQVRLGGCGKPTYSRVI
uniref:PD(D/E)XK endonuclease domain-containing protein n=1 Tax=Citrobacter phage NS1 TaxID=2766968 RepID=A0A7G9IRD7_9CAUD